jgi:hypothetical protein
MTQSSPIPELTQEEIERARLYSRARRCVELGVADNVYFQYARAFATEMLALHQRVKNLEAREQELSAIAAYADHAEGCSTELFDIPHVCDCGFEALADALQAGSEAMTHSSQSPRMESGDVEAVKD